MDIYCRFCGEPWEHDSLHDMPEDSPYKGHYDNVLKKNLGYEKSYTAFKKYGCGFFNHAWNNMKLEECSKKPVMNEEVLEKVEAAYSIYGADADALTTFLGDTV